MKVVFNGSLAEGFRVAAIVGSGDVIPLQTGNGITVVEMAAPSLVDEDCLSDPAGRYVLAVSTGLSSGISVFGPFLDGTSATEFAGLNFDGEAWEVFMVGHEEHHTEILQYQISFQFRGNDAPSQLDEESIEYIECCIRDGFSQGEFCVISEDGKKEYRGWWNIRRENDGE